MAIDPSDPRYVVASSDNLGSAAVEAYYSADGGQTWGQTALPLQDPAGTAGQLASESSVAADSLGRFYLAYGLVNVGAGTADVVVKESADHGQTWSTATYTAGLEGGFADVRPAVATDNWSFSPNVGNVYVVFTRFTNNQAHVWLTLYSSHSATWSPPVQVDALGETIAEDPAVTVLPSGRVFVAWDDPTRGYVYGGQCTVSGTAASCPAADQAVAVDDSLSPAGPGVTQSGLCTTSGCYGIPPQPNRGISPDISLASFGTSGGNWAIYLAYTAPETGAPGTRIAVAEAENGFTFTQDVAQLTEQTAMDYSFFPKLAVDPTTGEVWLSYYSTQDDGLLHEAANVYVTHWGGFASRSYEWAPPERVNVAALDEGVNGIQADVSNNYGDVMGLAAFGGLARPVWADPSDSLAAGAKIVTKAVPLTVPLQVTDGLTAVPANEVGWPGVAGASVHLYARAGTTVSTSVYDAVYTTPQALPGDHAYVATASTVDGTTAPSAVVTFNPSLVAPPAPTVTTTTTTATVTWSPVHGATSYDLFIGGLEWYSGGGITVSEATYLAAFTGVTGTSATITGLEPGAGYQFGVAAADAAGVPGQASPVAYAGTQAGAAAPTGLEAQALSPTTVQLYWRWLPLNGLTYNVYRSDGSAYTKIQSGLTVADVLDTSGLSPATTYSYYVTAETSAGESVGSQHVDVTTPTASPALAPTQVVALPTSPFAVSLSWTPPTGFAGTFNVWRALNPRSLYQRIATGISSNTYTDTSVQPGTSYFYAVQGVSGGAETPLSSAVEARTAPTSAPAAPASLAASAVSSTEIDLTWSPQAGATYDLYRGGGGQPLTEIATGVAGAQYRDTGLHAATTYEYTVVAIVNGVTGSWATPVSATTEGLPSPTDLKASVVSDSEIDLTWSAVAGASYNVYRSQGGGSASPVATGLANPTYGDTGLAASTAYTYYVTAVVGGVESAPSATATATTPAAPSTGTVATTTTTTTTSSGGGGADSPQITGISPTSGPAGTQVTITGTNFTGTNIVYFNGVPGTNLVVVSDTEITVDAPPGATGIAALIVQSDKGRNPVVASAMFTYTAGKVGVSSSVTTAGGTLSTTDGTFTMTVPAGDIAGSGTLTLTESTTGPSGLPASLTAASPTFTLAGATLTTPAHAVIQYQAAALNGRLPQRLAVYAQNPSGGWSYVPTAVGSDGKVTVTVSGPETLVVLADTQTFSDIPAGYWARQDIDALLAAGVISGYPDGTFQPGGVLTRAEFVKMLVIALGLHPGTAAPTFSDVSAGDWFAPYVAAAVQAGLVQGLTATTFGPGQTVSREQMAVLLARALKLNGGGQLSFHDAGAIDPYAAAAVQAAVAAGYLSGFPDGTFQPQAPTTRAQAAKVLAAVLAKLAQAAGAQ